MERRRRRIAYEATWDLHGLTVHGQTNSGALWERWRAAFASRPAASTTEPDISLSLQQAAAVPLAPAQPPSFRQGELLAYHVAGAQVTAHFPRYGQLTLDLAKGTTAGVLAPAALSTYGVLEDVLAIALAPHLRRRGLYFIHAFAAARNGRALLLVGDRGAGKTTTGLSLLDGGWQLLSNDSPLVNSSGEALGYPGVLAGYPATFARFAATQRLAAEWADPEEKILVSAESIWPDAWVERAPVAAICLLQIRPGQPHGLQPLSAPEALRSLLPHSVEQWDKAMIPAHLAALRRLVQRAPAYQLYLGPDVPALPAVLEPLVAP